MIIPYNNGRIYLNLAFAIAWIGISIALAVVDWTQLGFDNYLWFFIAFLYSRQYYIDSRLHYIVVKDNQITRNSLLRKTLDVDEIIRVDNTWDEYVLHTRTSRLKIRLQTAHLDAVPKLEAFLEELSANTRKSIWAEAQEKTA